MKEPDQSLDIIERPNEGKRLRLVHGENRQSLPPDTKLQTLFEEIKGKKRKKYVRLKFDDGLNVLCVNVRDGKRVKTGEAVTFLKVLKRATRLELATLSLGS